MTYSSVVPSEMTNKELISICGELQTAKNWGANAVTIQLKNGNAYRMPVYQLKDYQEEVSTQCGATLV